MQWGLGQLQDMPFDEENAPWKMDDGTIDFDLKEEYMINSSVIRHNSEEGECILFKCLEYFVLLKISLFYSLNRWLFNFCILAGSVQARYKFSSS